MDCPATLTEKIAMRLSQESSLEENAIQQLCRYLEGETSLPPDWNSILKPPSTQPDTPES
jgi:hypothetical protein